jgi:hypothetical protein
MNEWHTAEMRFSPRTSAIAIQLIQRRANVNRLKVIALVFCMALLAGTFATSSYAQNRDKRTKVTFTEPVEIPGGVVLQPGTYTFHLLPSWENRYIVQISNEREDHMYATVLTIPRERPRSSSKTIITFKEVAAGEPPAVHVWWFPGDTTGREFVYPKKRAIEIAKVSNEPVLSMPQELAPNLTANTPPENAYKDTTVTTIQPSGEEAPLAQETPKPVETAPTPAPTPTPTPAPAPEKEESLPHTASSLPLIGLMGLVSTLMACGLWFLRKRAVL